MLRLCGAELVEVPAVPYSNPNNYVKISDGSPSNWPRPKSTARSGQTNSTTSPTGRATSRLPAPRFGSRPTQGGRFHLRGRHRWHARGRRDGAEGSHKNVRIAEADPMGAALYSYYTQGVWKSEGSSITEGIGQGRITGIWRMLRSIRRSRFRIRKPSRSSSTCSSTKACGMGGSTASTSAGAIRLAKELGPGHTIVTILCDYGTRYQSKLFNPAFLREKKPACPAVA